jgi:5-oxopent-3-ene-1,2,5-tricarboxylate decarboxylase/2-hydroxyhepta-2,4-diene-1,7-dioate isomerase
MRGSLAETRDEAAPRAVYGVLLNFRNELAALGNAVNEPPYKQPPRAPILYVKPANTWIGEGALIPLPSGEPVIQPGATLGIVFGRTATRVSERHAFDHVAGYCVVNDVRLPHPSYYRPALRQLCRDGFCAIGARVVGPGQAGNVNALALRTYVNGSLQHEANTADLVRSVPRLIADITEFMTLAPGDILMVGVAAGRPDAREGDRIRIEVEGIGYIDNPVIAENRVMGVTA